MPPIITSTAAIVSERRIFADISLPPQFLVNYEANAITPRRNAVTGYIARASRQFRGTHRAAVPKARESVASRDTSPCAPFFRAPRAPGNIRVPEKWERGDRPRHEGS